MREAAPLASTPRPSAAAPFSPPSSVAPRLPPDRHHLPRDRPRRVAHTNRGNHFEETLLINLANDGLPCGWDTHSTVEPAAAAAAAAAKVSSGRRIRFVSEAEWDREWQNRPLAEVSAPIPSSHSRGITSQAPR